MLVIGTDHGNKQMKTTNCPPFISGLKESIITKSLITKEAGTSPTKVWFPASHTHHRYALWSART